MYVNEKSIGKVSVDGISINQWVTPPKLGAPNFFDTPQKNQTTEATQVTDFKQPTPQQQSQQSNYSSSPQPNSGNKAEGNPMSQLSSMLGNGGLESLISMLGNGGGKSDLSGILSLLGKNGGSPDTMSLISTLAPMMMNGGMGNLLGSKKSPTTESGRTINLDNYRRIN
jgi:hypothetical protein